MFTTLIIIFFISFLMLLFCIITLVAKIINKRSVKLPLIMLNLFFVVTTMTFIFGTIIFANQNQINLFKDTTPTDSKKEELIETGLIQEPTEVIKDIEIPTTHAISYDFKNLDWDSIFYTSTNEVQSNFNYFYVKNMNQLVYNNEIDITITVPDNTQSDQIVSVIDYTLKSINENARQQLEDLAPIGDDYYGGLFDYFSANIVIINDEPPTYIMVDHYIKKGAHMSDLINIYIESNHNGYYTSKYSNRVNIVREFEIRFYNRDY